MSRPLLHALARTGLAALALLGACAPTGPWTRAAALAPALARLDTDGDGVVGEAEYARVAVLGPAFAVADADGDGAFSVDELDALTQAQDPSTAVAAASPARGGPGGPGGPGGGPGGGPAPSMPTLLPGSPPPPPGVVLRTPDGRAFMPAQEGGPPGAAPPANAGGAPTGGAAFGAPMPPVPPSPPNPPTPPNPQQRPKRGDVWVLLMVLREEVLARDPAAAVPTPEQIVAADRAGGLDSPAARDALAVLARESDRLAIDFPRALRRP